MHYSPAPLHIPDGFLSAAVAAVGWALAIAAIAYALRQTRGQFRRQTDSVDGRPRRLHLRRAIHQCPRRRRHVGSLVGRRIGGDHFGTLGGGVDHGERRRCAGDFVSGWRHHRARF